MKWLIVLADGMSDYPLAQLDGKTPMEVATKPAMNTLAANGKCMLVRTIQDHQKPGSDVANLSVLGYNPDEYYTGRSPLEAASIGVALKDNQTSFRANLVCIKDEIMQDYSAGEIPTAQADQLIKAVEQALSTDYIHFYTGVSYRHLMVWENADDSFELTPPHDISDKPIAEYIPKNQTIRNIMMESRKVLEEHPVNKERQANGQVPANSLWIWGEGKRPKLSSFKEKFGVDAAVISAVDLINGIGALAGMKVISVEGATGNIDTNFEGKGQAAVKALADDVDLVYLHVEAPDECGHRGEIENKIKSIEMIDKHIVAYAKQELSKLGEDYKIMVLCDHATPIALKTHVKDPVPCFIYDSRMDEGKSQICFCEKVLEQMGESFEPGYELMEKFLRR